MKHFALPLLALALPLSACDSTDDDTDDDTGDLVTITAAVVADADLSTLEAAVLEAGLDDDLAGTGPFTVFAPRDTAFADLLADLDVTADELLARDDLSDILQLHVVSGTFDEDDLDVGDVLTTLNGETLTVVDAGDAPGLDGEDADTEADAVIVTTDIDASNGIIHKIDTVLIPTDD